MSNRIAGLRDRIGKTAELKDSPELQGKLRKVAHLVQVEGN